MPSKSKPSHALNQGTESDEEVEEVEEVFDDDFLRTTSNDRRRWAGWATVESEPAIFTFMLKRLGVKGTKTCEIFTLDASMLDSLPQPVYGIVFLSKWKEDLDNYGQDNNSIGPEKIWFANQTVDNSCATLALLNIIYNVPHIELGENLKAFKEFTSSFTSELKGEAIANFEFARLVHNSFARKMDMLNADLYMKNEATVKKKRKGLNSSDEDAVYHFDAFVPVNGQLWKLDGLRQPVSLGSFGSTHWLDLVRLNLTERMSSYEATATEFTILGVVRDPLIPLTVGLAENIKTLVAIETELEARVGERVMLEIQEGGPDITTHRSLRGIGQSYGIDAALLDGACISTVISDTLQVRSIEELLQDRSGVMQAQVAIRREIKQQQDEDLADEEKCMSRTYDHCLVLRDWLKFNCQNRSIKKIVESIQPYQ